MFFKVNQKLKLRLKGNLADLFSFFTFHFIHVKYWFAIFTLELEPIFAT